MEKLKKLKAAYQVCVNDMQALLDSSDDVLSEEAQVKFDALKSKAANLKTQIANHEEMEVQKAEAARMVDGQSKVLPRQAPADSLTLLDDPTKTTGQSQAIKIPAKCRRWSGRLKSFKGPNAEQDAYRAAMWLAASLCKSQFAQNFCNTHGISTDFVNYDPAHIQSLHQEGVNVSGGYLVFDEFETTIIRLVEEFGLVRRKMKNIPMIGDTKSTPRRTGGLTSYFVGEGGQATESTGSWDMVKLVAKKLAAITVSSNELVSDAIISIADELTREIALAFATKEDNSGFQGDGTSTYGGIFGLVPRLSALNGVDDGGGLVLAAGNLFSEVTDANLLKLMGIIPNYPGLMPEWYCSKPFWYQVMVRLIRATGGATMAEMDGERRLIYAGYPVNWTSGTTAMPTTDANSQIACLFGDLPMAAQFGDRAGITIATTTEATVGDTSMFDTDSFAVRGIERFDINVHDVGTATAAGPIAGLIMAAS